MPSPESSPKGLEEEIAKWTSRFGSVLRTDEKQAFEDLLNRAKKYTNTVKVFEENLAFKVLALLLLLEHQAELQRLRSMLIGHPKLSKETISMKM